MAPSSDESNVVEVVNSPGNNAEKLPWKARLGLRLTKLMESLRIFIYNKEEQKFFGNTSSSWIKISVYYAVFYVCLGLFFSGMVAVFGAIISRQSPTYWYHNNAMNMDGNVYIGMGFRPMPVITSTAITVYNDTASQNDTTTSLTIYRIEFLTQYDLTYVQQCSPWQPASQLPAGYACQFTWTDIVATETHPCSATNMYGWTAGQPCMLIKLNQIYGWTPTAGNITGQVANAIGQPVSSVDQRENNIYITCNGASSGDRNILGNMTYYSLLSPQGNSAYGGIPYYFYPYMNSEQYVEPFVLVQFTTLPMRTTVNVECRAWAPNIQQYSQGTARRGLVTFSLYRSDQSAPSKT